MVIYAQRIRYGMGTLGVASGVPALHGPAGHPRVPGMCLIAPAWLRRQESSAFRPASRTADMRTAQPANTLKRDAFAGILPGLHSMEPPV